MRIGLPSNVGRENSRAWRNARAGTLPLCGCGQFDPQPDFISRLSQGKEQRENDQYRSRRPPPPPPPPRSRKPPPPPPPARSVLGRASFTLSVRPPTCEPFNAVIAFSPSSLLAISTNPKPRDRPVSRSVIMLTRSTWPKGSKSCRNSSSAVLKLRLPTKIFFTLLPLHCSVGVRAQFGGLQGGRTLLKIETGAGEQSNAAEVEQVSQGTLSTGILIYESGKGEPRPQDSDPQNAYVEVSGLASIDFPKTFTVITDFQQPVLGIVPFTALWANHISAPRCAAAGVIRGHSKGRAATAWHQEHA